MAHELERLADGSTAFAAARVPAWHRLGTVTTGAMTASEVIATARLGGWDVRKIPVVGVDPETRERVVAPGKAMTVRTVPVTGEVGYLGVVGLLTDHSQASVLVK
jgi:hypothetical protein